MCTKCKSVDRSNPMREVLKFIWGKSCLLVVGEIATHSPTVRTMNCIQHQHNVTIFSKAVRVKNNFLFWVVKKQLLMTIQNLSQNQTLYIISDIQRTTCASLQFLGSWGCLHHWRLCLRLCVGARVCWDGGDLHHSRPCAWYSSIHNVPL